jgi:LmbE family N-acetylglucosaminyl deacetylase
MGKKCLVFAAHPDDETNGVGGTLFRLWSAGWKIRIVYATLPESHEIADKRAQACMKVCSVLDADIELWREPDAKLEVSARTRAMAVRTYANFQPDLVLVMHPADVHPDHRAMSDIAMGPALQKGVNTEIFTYELCSSGRHTDGDRPQTLGFLPTHYVHTTSVIEEVAVLQRFHDTEDPEAMIRGMRNVHGNRAREAGSSGFAEAFIRLTRWGPIQHGLEQLFVPSPRKLPRPIGVDFKLETIGL